MEEEVRRWRQQWHKRGRNTEPPSIAFGCRIINCHNPPPFLNPVVLFYFIYFLHHFFFFFFIYSTCADQIGSLHTARRFMFLFNESPSTHPLHANTHTHPPLKPTLLLASIAFSAQGCEWVPRVSLNSLEFCWGSLIFHWDHGNRDCPPPNFPATAGFRSRWPSLRGAVQMDKFKCTEAF